MEDNELMDESLELKDEIGFVKFLLFNYKPKIKVVIHPIRIFKYWMMAKMNHLLLTHRVSKKLARMLDWMQNG